MALTSPPAHTFSLDARHARQQRMLWMFVGASLLLHAVIVFVFVVVRVPQKSAIDLDATIIKTRLVKLGKTRDEALLPRLPTSPPPPPAETKSTPTPEPVPQKPMPQETKKASAADVLNKFEKEQAKATDVNSIIKNRIGEVTDEGKEDGDKMGTDLTGDMQASYFARVTAHIRSRMEVSATLTDDERVRLRAVLTLQIGEEGEVLDARIAKSSGSTIFDSDVLMAAKRASPVPAPPPPVRALAAKGVGFNFCPVSCS